ncbi:MAG: hypothetical protein HY261_02540 [Chloroflexi bacterium]|nr:hypothetical protein [Chloroflexota bacterium]
MLCDRIVLIEHGRLIEERNVEALKDELRRFSIVYRGQASMIGLSEEWRERSDGTFYARFTGKKGLMQAMERVFAAGAELIDVTADQGSFEDYFVQAIGRSA